MAAEPPSTLLFLSTLSLRRATTILLLPPLQFMDFYPRSPCGERPPNRRSCPRSRNFYPRSPCGERPLVQIIMSGYARISIHALLAESDLLSCFVRIMSVSFLSTLSLRRATRYFTTLSVLFIFLSTLSLRRATQKWPSLHRLQDISIHALLAESDVVHALKFADAMLFLSTLSLRRATLAGPSGPAFLYNFYPRSPCGERPTDMRQRLIEFRFLSTLSLRRATGGRGRQRRDLLRFLSTLSLRRAT